jgi:hypothetical protein
MQKYGPVEILNRAVFISGGKMYWKRENRRIV